ncbi:MAG: PTH1 family peptidyl-tRNA hydrolase [Candidatus Deianiraeaceae bacterium]|jgi:PTH1 family peptidyl-tRNA hydrolase
MLIVGLGNTGSRYEYTLHNMGFIIVDHIVKYIKPNHTWAKKFSGEYSMYEHNNKKIMFLKPTTYMNNSGICVAQYKNFFKIQSDEIFVFHDDIDLKVGQVKIKTGGGNGGHNGLKSLDAHIGCNYHRIRIGIGRPQHKDDVSNFVLSKFQSENLEQVHTISNLFRENITFLLEKKFSLLKDYF